MSWLAPDNLQLTALRTMPWLAPDSDDTHCIQKAIMDEYGSLQDGDIIVIAQKIISLSEGRLVLLSSINPSSTARELAEKTGKDPRLVEIILRQSKRVVRVVHSVIIVENHLGMILANAGVDCSNVPSGKGSPAVLLLPKDPDQSSRRIRKALQAYFNVQLGVIIADSIGRAWRNGTIGHAIGVSGITALADFRGRPDHYERTLEVSTEGVADELAAAATLLMGQGSEGKPVVIIRGINISDDEAAASDLLRDKETDLFL